MLVEHAETSIMRCSSFFPFDRKDTSPIVESCNCFTCQNHTKAYLNHLFNVHEMLAQTLLEMYEFSWNHCYFTVMYLSNMIISGCVPDTTHTSIWDYSAQLERLLKKASLSNSGGTLLKVDVNVSLLLHRVINL